MQKLIGALARDPRTVKAQPRYMATPQRPSQMNRMEPPAQPPYSSNQEQQMLQQPMAYAGGSPRFDERMGQMQTMDRRYAPQSIPQFNAQPFMPVDQSRFAQFQTQPMQRPMQMQQQQPQQMQQPQYGAPMYRKAGM